jgi:dipeptidyl-peptidase-4
MRSVPALLCAVLGALPASAQQLSFDLVFDTGEQRPESAAWSPDGGRLAYLWGEEEARALVVLDVASGESRQVLALAPRSEEDADLGGIDAYHWHPEGTSLLVEWEGDLFLASLAGGGVERLTETAVEEKDPKFSPGGDRVAFVRDQDLYLLELATGEVSRATTDGEAGVLLNAQTDWVYWEELWGRDSTGYWWAPDGRRIAYYQFDERPVREYALVDFQTQYPTVDWQKYPKAGEANPVVRVGVLDLASGSTTWIETGTDQEWYLPRVDWLPDGRLAVQRLSREQDRLDLLRCDPGTGSCSTWISETRPTWVDVSDEYHFLPDGRLIWPSERSGWNQLYLVDADGAVVRQLSSAEGAVTSLVGLDDRGAVLYQAYGAPPLGALGRQIHRVGLDGSSAQVISASSGFHEALLSPGGRYRLDTESSAAAPARQVVRASDGRELARLPYQPPGFDASALPQREFLTIDDGAGNRLPASIIRPAGFDASKRYPAIMYHYGGPESQVVLDAWSTGSRELWTRLMAERGYVLFSVDNPGSTYFGQQGADRQHRRFGEVNLAAQRAGVAYLRSLDWVDGDRIGLWGWSGGGSNTLYCVLNAPGTWRAAVSGAPVTDWRLYDTIWTERYLDHPANNPEGYRDSSAVTWAGQLEDALLLVHGTADDNVHPQNSLVMSQAFIEAGVPFDWAIYPRQKHGFQGAASRHFYEKMTTFFERELAPRPPVVEGEPPPQG